MLPVCGVYNEYGVIERVRLATAPYLAASAAP